VHPNQVASWKRQAVDGLPDVFADGRSKKARDDEEHEARLYQQIGRLQFELDWLRKKLDGSTERKREMVEPGNERLSIARQCQLLGFSRSGYYYRPQPVSDEDLELMRLIDEEYTRHPFYGSRRLADWLTDQGHPVGRDRVRRLMRMLGLEAIYPRKRLSVGNREHRKYPYLLESMSIDRPNQVWCSGITYIRLRGGFVYLVAVMDWHSRCVLSWELSNTLDSNFCVAALDRAMIPCRPG